MEIEEKIIKALPRIANRLLSELILTCPVDKGGLRANLKVRPSADGIGLIIWMNEYGKYVEFGTPPHIIKPKNKQALKFKGEKGKFVIVKEVKHPGTRPNPFVRNAIQTKLQQIIIEELKV